MIARKKAGIFGPKKKRKMIIIKSDAAKNVDENQVLIQVSHDGDDDDDEVSQVIIDI